MENEPSWALLARYASGECTSEEACRVEAWMRADPSRRQLVEELRDIWTAADAPSRRTDREVDVEAGWRQVRSKMGADGPGDSVDEPDRRARKSRSRAERRPFRRRTSGWRIGAVAGLLLLVGGLWLAQSLWKPAGAPSDPAYRTVVTEPGERSRIQLADGSSVMLNVDSKLRLPTPFDQKRRVVKLTGEAYFEVDADPDRPFVVRTGDASVEVRGTAFNVRGYPDEKQVQVAVTEGGVSFRPERTGASAAVELESGDVGRMAPDTTVRTRAADVTDYIGWTEGRLVFEDTPLTEVARRLERWYNLEVRIRDPELRSLRLTATLRSESARNVLDVVTTTLDIGSRIDGRTVVLMTREEDP